MSEELFKQMAQSIIDGDPEQAVELARQALEQGVDPLAAITKGYAPGMDVVGELFETGEYFLPDLVIAGEAMTQAVKVLEPELIKRHQTRETLGKVVIGTVEGDIHEIGKNLVATMLSAAGFQVYDLGVDVPAQAFVDKVREVGADIVGLSALLTTTMLNQAKVIEALQEASLRERVKVAVGGAPVNQDWAEEIGADAYCENAMAAVRWAREAVKH